MPNEEMLAGMTRRISTAMVLVAFVMLFWPSIKGQPKQASAKIAAVPALQVIGQQRLSPDAYAGSMVTFGLTTVTLVAMFVFKNNFGRRFAVQDAKIDGLSSDLGKMRVTLGRLEQSSEHMAEKMTRLDERFVAFPADVALKISTAVDKRRLESEQEFVPRKVCEVMHADLNRRVDRMEDLSEKRGRQ